MTGFNTDSIMSAVEQEADKKVAEVANSIIDYLIYDAAVENIIIRKKEDIDYDIHKDGNGRYSLTINMDGLNDYYKQLVHNIYYKDALKRRA